MARTIAEIKLELTNNFINNPTVQTSYGLTPGRTFEQDFSIVSIESILFYVVAFSICVFEQLLDTHKVEIQGLLDTLLPHTSRWYQQKSLAFQFGFNLLVESDKFDNTGASLEDINTSKIIKYASITEADSRLIIKVAKDNNGTIIPLTTTEKNAFTDYMQQIKDAGVRLTILSYQPDLLDINMTVYINPLVMDLTGADIINGGYPVEEAIKSYLKSLPFNGELIVAHLVDAVQLLEGVRIPEVDSIFSKWIDPATNGYSTPTIIQTRKVAESGYFQVQNFSINYVL